MKHLPWHARVVLPMTRKAPGRQKLKAMKLILILLTVLTVAIVACTSHSREGRAEQVQILQADKHQGYTCTMNCENGKIYAAPGNCPRCGMELSPVTQVSQKAKEYKMDYESFPAELIPGSPGSLYFTPKVKDHASEQVALDRVHEKKIHLIIVNDDLSYFDHVHPAEDTQGSYRIRVLSKDQPYSLGPGNDETRFEQAGTYYLFADYQPSQAVHQLEKILVNLPGKVPGPARYTAPVLSNRSGNFTAKLETAGGTLTAGAPVHLTASLYKDNRLFDANHLDNYLGAKAHIVSIGLHDKEYIHLHPEVSGEKFQIMTVFSNPGIYRAWLQFRAEDKLHTIDFTIMVNKANHTLIPNNVQHDMHHDHKH